MQRLALLGGPAVRKRPYAPHITTGEAEIAAVNKVMRRGVLSEFEGTNNRYFLGGQQVRLLEEEWARKFKSRYAVTFNSATSALYASIGACGIGPGDEVVITPYTMSATPTAILAYNAIPVFSDVELEHYNLDPRILEKRITPRTRAIFVVHIFGHPADMAPIMKIARKRNLYVIEDAAQAPGARYHGKLAGAIGDIGIFSLNSNKVIQCGEGGVAVTDSKTLASKLRLIRNHAEAVIASGFKVDSLINMVGFNYRMNEVEAAIARVQLKRLDNLNSRRLRLVTYLNKKLARIDGLSIPLPEKGSTHVYYRYAIRIDPEVVGMRAPLLVRALNAEGMDFYVSYMKPLYLQPLYQSRIAYGKKGCPFTCPMYKGRVDYSKGLCPNTERLGDIIVSTEIVRPPQTFKDMDEIVCAIEKVVANKDQLRKRFPKDVR